MRPVGFLALVAVAAAALGEAAEPTNEVMVECHGQNANATMQGDLFTYTCSKGLHGSDTTMMSADFQVNVNASTLTLDIQNGSVLQTLNFTGIETAPPTLKYKNTLSFRTLTDLYSLTFENVAFEPPDVKLEIPDKVNATYLLDTKLTDFSIPDYNDTLTYINLDGTSFSKIPKLLYETNYSDTVNITVNLMSVIDTNMSTTDYNTLVFNVKTLNQHKWTEEYEKVPCPNTSEASGYTVVNFKSAASTSGEDDLKKNAGDNSSGVSTGALVAIIVVVVVIALVLAFFILRMHFRRKAANASAHNEATTTLMSKGDATADKGSFISNDEFLRNFRLPQSDVLLVKSVGTGRLWMGEYNSEKVIVKRVESEVTDPFVTKALMAQARSFATISHPNITNLVGVTWLAGTDFAVVTEFMDKGNLKTVLSNTDVDLDVTTKLQMCLDLALALAYLHESEQNMCAKKLSSHKVLVNSALNCKLSLFECVPSSAKIGGSATFSYGMGEVAWLAPEIITRSSPMDARKNNTYAFGVLVSEIFTRVSPYQTLIQKQGNTLSDVELVKRVRRQEPLVPHENRPAFQEAPASVRQLVEQCLLYAPMSRPTAKDLVDVLHRAKEELATDVI